MGCVGWTQGKLTLGDYEQVTFSLGPQFPRVRRVSLLSSGLHRIHAATLSKLRKRGSECKEPRGRLGKGRRVSGLAGGGAAGLWDWPDSRGRGPTLRGARGACSGNVSFTGLPAGCTCAP